MNEKDKALLNFMNSLVIADTTTLSEVASAKGLWEADKAYPNVYKACNGLADLKKIEKHKGFWRLPNCKSEYGEHAQLLTKSLAEILKTPYQVISKREKTIDEVGLRPDLLVLLKKGDMGRCFIYEEVNNENPDFTAMKRNTWLNWEGARDYLTKLFGYVIPHFDFLTSDELQSYLREAL